MSMATILSCGLLVMTLTAGLAQGVVYTCSVRKYGEFTKFNGETSRIKAPCKYRLAEFECGTYNIKLTVGSEPDGNKFSPASARVIVDRTTASGVFRTWTGRMDKGRLASGLAWEEISGNLTMNVNTYDSSTNTATIADNNYKFQIDFSFGGDDDGVKAECTAIPAKFVPLSFPTSFCGVKNETNHNELYDRRQELFTGSLVASYSEVILHDLLNDQRIEHITQCGSVAAQFRQCSYQKEVVAYCGPVWGWGNLVNCLDDAPYNSFKDCMDAVCDNAGSLTSVCSAFSSQTCAAGWLTGEGCL